MNLGRESILSFSPVDPDLYEVAFTVADGESWRQPVIGFSVVVVYAGKDGESSDTHVYPVVIDDNGTPTNVLMYLEDFLTPLPAWSLRRKDRT